MDKVKGRLKQAAGSVAGDEQLKRQGERDEAAGKVKQKVDSINEALRVSVGMAGSEDGWCRPVGPCGFACSK